MRIRLNSTVVRVQHDGRRTRANGVRVAYLRDGKVHGVRAANVVLACNNSADSGADAGVAREAERGARLLGQGADDVQQRPHPALDVVCEARRGEHQLAVHAAHRHQPRSRIHRRRVPRRHDARRADPRPHDEQPEQARASAQGAEPRGQRAAALDDRSSSSSWRSAVICPACSDRPDSIPRPTSSG